MSKSQVMCVGCDNPAGKQDAESDGFCEECIAFATDRVTPVAAQAGDEPMRAAPSVKPSEWCAETPLNAIIDGDALSKSKRIMALIDNYTEAMDSPINQHARDARTAIRCALMAEFEAAQVSPRATADVEREKEIAGLRTWLSYAVRQSECDMILTGEECRRISAVLATTKPGA